MLFVQAMNSMCGIVLTAIIIIVIHIMDYMDIDLTVITVQT